jgi:hypothetical protein
MRRAAGAPDVARLVYSSITSLDGYVADADGNFDWCAPDEEVHAAIRRLKAIAERDLTVGGPGLAAEALRAGLVDECQVFVSPVVVGGGTRSLPDDVRLRLELLDEHRFTGGVVYLRYRVATP